MRTMLAGYRKVRRNHAANTTNNDTRKRIARRSHELQATKYDRHLYNVALVAAFEISIDARIGKWRRARVGRWQVWATKWAQNRPNEDCE